MIRFAGARAALAAFEGKQALRNYVVAAVLAAAAALFALATYALLVVLAVVALGKYAGMNPFLAVAALAGGHLIVFLVLVGIAFHKLTRPTFRHFIEQIKKDKEWITNDSQKTN